MMSVISTFETQCRALSSTASPDENASRFLVGTLSPIANDNFVYLFEYKDDSGNLARVSMKFPFGEIWHLSSSSKHLRLFSAVTGRNGTSGVSLFKLPQGLENTVEDDFGFPDSPIEKIFDITEDSSVLTNQSHWHPDDGHQVLVCNKGLLEIWDLENQQKIRSFSVENSLRISESSEDQYLKQIQLTDMRWSSLFNCSVIAGVVGSNIFGFDTRIADSSPSSICWSIKDKRCNRVRSIDFNPNSQYYLASGGDDCRANFWDLRKTQDPALYMQSHTHWIWSIRFNPFHDQLVLSAGSDSRAILMRAQSISSEPICSLQDEDTGEEGGDEDNLIDDNPQADDINHAKTSSENSEPEKDSRFSDEIVKIYDEHDDSIYSAEWASDPWIFATLGFESRLIISKVPKAEKFNILFR